MLTINKHLAVLLLSTTGAKIRPEYNESDSFPKALTNIKLNLITLNESPQVSEDVYAKVIDLSSENGGFTIHFTSIPSPVETQLNRIYKWILTKALETENPTP